MIIRRCHCTIRYDVTSTLYIISRELERQYTKGYLLYLRSEFAFKNIFSTARLLYNHEIVKGKMNWKVLKI